LATVERFFPFDHAAAQGHFPGNPIIPAAVLLSEAIDAVESAFGLRLSPLRIKSVKFPAPVRPGDRVLIEYQRAREDSIRIVCRVGATAVLVGEVIWDASTGA